MVLLDTNILAAIYNQEVQVKNRLFNEEPSSICTSIFCVTETWYGIKLKADSHKKRNLDVFFNDFFQNIFIFNYEREAMNIFTDLKVKCKQSGKIIEDNDLYIAATALANECTLITRNVRHFENIEDLQIEAW